MGVEVVSVHYELLVKARDILRELGLEGFTRESFYLRKIPTNAGVTYPCCLVTPWHNETLEKGNFEDHEIGYPVLLTFLDREAALTFELTDGRELLWRQQAIDALIDLPQDIETAEVYDCQIDAVSIVDVKAFLGESEDESPLYVSPLLLRFMTTRTRGRG